MLRKKRTTDDRRVGDLSLDELEAIVDEKRRIARARAFAEEDGARRFSPITVAPQPGPSRKKRKPRSWRDNLLLLVELAAAAALLYIIYAAFNNLQTLNQEVALAVRGPTAPLSQSAGPNGTSAPNETPLADASSGQAVGELPGSSFAPVSNGELPGSSSPPEALPAAIGVNVQPLPALPPPTPGPQSPTRIVIASLNVDWPIVPGDGWEDLKRGVGHHVGSVNPGERGNVILSGHNDVFGEVFKDLETLKNGEQVILYAGGKAYKYEVRAKRIVAPNDLSVLNNTREAVVTLITCHPYRVDTHRLVVVAQLVP